MKKISILLMLMMVMFLAACGQDTTSEVQGSTSTETKTDTSKTSKEPLTAQEFTQMLSNPKNFKGSYVEYVGKVFTVEKDENGTYLQVWADPEKSDNNTIVAIQDPNFNVTDEDFIIIKGTVRDEFKGENAFGAELILPVIDAESYEVADYITAVSPTLHELAVNQGQDQHGYVVNVEKVEFGQKDTRVYVSIKNESDSTINFWSFDAKLVQGGKQLDVDYAWEANYPELQSDIRPGVTSEGILSFPTLDFESGEAIKLYLNGSSDDWDVTIEEFLFDIEIN
ncbi:MAG: DUF4352 domain-containing protein [Bacillaceae bacterium]|nr:DUF4352 domain-containing protein [Bacillaceae bacterium]